MIECDAPTANLPAMLALPRNAIVKRRRKTCWQRTVCRHRWDPGKKLTFIARDDYWGSRAFVDSIEIKWARAFRDQMIALDLGKADVVEVAPEQASQAARTAAARIIQRRRN